jgi:hypothetical protein
MIQFDKDGTTLFYIDANGKKISHNYLEGPAYDAMLTTRDAQIGAIVENTQTQANYSAALSNAQTSVSAGRPVDAPPKPLMKVVSDAGDVAYAPFDPPLADLVPLAPAPTKAPTPLDTMQANTIDTVAVALANVLNCSKLLVLKIGQLQSDVSALKTKFGL